MAAIWNEINEKLEKSPTTTSSTNFAAYEFEFDYNEDTDPQHVKLELTLPVSEAIALEKELSKNIKEIKKSLNDLPIESVIIILKHLLVTKQPKTDATFVYRLIDNYLSAENDMDELLSEIENALDAIGY